MASTRAKRRTAAAVLMVLAVAGCTGGERAEEPTTGNAPTAPSSASASPSAGRPAAEATPAGSASTPGVPDVPDCVLSAEEFAAVVGVDEAESEGGPDYGYPGDKFCYYVADERAWNVYLFPRDGDHAQAQRRGAAAHHSDVTSFELAGASDAIQFNAGSYMLFATGDFVVKVECPLAGRPGLAPTPRRSRATEPQRVACSGP